jgi:hypothetical protein
MHSTPGSDCARKCRSPLTFRSSGSDLTTISRGRGRCQRESESRLPWHCSSATRVALPTEGDKGSRHSLHSPQRTSLVVLARARGIVREHQSLSLKARGEEPPGKQEMTFSASKEKRADGGSPVAAARGVRRLNDGSRRIGAIALPSKTEPGVSVPGPAAGPGTSSRWAPGSTSSKSPQSPGFQPRCHGPGGPFSYEGRKKGRKTSARAPKAPGHCRSLEVLPSRSRPWRRPWEWTNLPQYAGRLLQRSGRAGSPDVARPSFRFPTLVGTGFRGRVDLDSSAAAVGGLSSIAFELLKDVLHRLVVADRVVNPAVVVVVACDNDGAVGKPSSAPQTPRPHSAFVHCRSTSTGFECA